MTAQSSRFVLVLVIREYLEKLGIFYLVGVAGFEAASQVRFDRTKLALRALYGDSRLF